LPEAAGPSGSAGPEAAGPIRKLRLETGLAETRDSPFPKPRFRLPSIRAESRKNPPIPKPGTAPEFADGSAIEIPIRGIYPRRPLNPNPALKILSGSTGIRCFRA
jgi:hypothetical protein